MYPSWDEPCVEGDDYAAVLVPYYEYIVRFVAPMLGEPVSARYWEGCKATLDLLPTTAELVNDRWRTFVGEVWKMRSGYIDRARRLALAHRLTVPKVLR